MIGWIGVDLDGTLAHYDSGQGIATVGAPVPRMLARVLAWLADGEDVRVFTARANEPGQIPLIEEWCQRHLGVVLPVTATKDYEMVQLWDDRAVAVRKNTGEAKLW